MTKTAFEQYSSEELAAMMTDHEKGSILSGKDFWCTKDLPRLGIPSLKMSDGPNGVRGASHFRSTPATCIPCATALASTWNKELLEQVGALLARETKAKSSSLLLAPTVNIQRSPLGGRSFECFSEDPHLSGHIASAYVKGLQDNGIGAVIKHFVGNDQEHERRAANSAIPERALREIYLMPFMIAQREVQPWCIMTAYNKLDGIHVSQNKRVLRDILREEWGFKGLVVSDWFGTNSCGEGIKAGQDLEMPGPPRWRGELIAYSLTAGTVTSQDLARCAIQVMNLVKKCVKACPEVIERGIEEVRKSEADEKLNRHVAAEGIVLLKNTRGLLPLNPKGVKKVALIGPNLKARVFSGGGSALLSPAYFVSPYEGIRKSFGDDVEVTFVTGCTSHRFLPLMNGKLRLGPEPNAPEGWKLEWFNDSEATIKVGEDCLRETQLFFRESLPPALNLDRFYGRVTGYFTPDAAGIYSFSLSVRGKAKLFVDDQLVTELWDQEQRHGTAMYGLGSQEVIGDIHLAADRTVKVVIQYSSEQPVRKGPMPKQPFILLGGVRLGGLKKVVDINKEIQTAARVAAESDVAIVCVGTSSEWESEASDRATIKAPGECDDLVAAVTKAQPNTVVINQSGSAVSMPWAQQASSIVQCFFSGNETGNALADVLFGRVNPSGKLPITFPERDCDVPAYRSLTMEANGSIPYTEGLFVGYKWYEDRMIRPLFPFGHGLSYTTFEYRSITAKAVGGPITAGGKVVVSVSLQNTGTRAGQETVQLYVSDVECSLQRPLSELRGFSKVHLEPGESTTVRLSLDRTAFAFFDDYINRFRVEAGEFIIRAGASSANLPLQVAVHLGEEDAGTFIF